jgi:hypothetical protein
MQALIDFDGWRKWKDIAEINGLKDPSKPAGAPVKPARKALKAAEAAAAKKPPTPTTTEEKTPITATSEVPSKVPDPKSLDSTGLEAVGTEGAETKDSADAVTVPTEAGGVDGVKGEEGLGRMEDSPDTIVHAPAAGAADENAVVPDARTA